MPKLILVEDEEDFSKLIKKYFILEKFEVLNFNKAEEVIDYIDDSVDIYVLDIMLKGKMNGFDLLNLIKEKGFNTPVIFISARDKDIDKIKGLELGSDDYISKPFSIRELVLRVKAILRRSIRIYENNNQYENYLIDFEQKSVKNIIDNSFIELTSKEFAILEFYLQNQGKELSREEILNAIWGDNYFGSNRVVDDTNRRLRMKMPELRIDSIYAYGYRLNK